MVPPGPFRHPGIKGRNGANVNLVTLVMRVVDPVRNAWNRRDELGASLVEYALLLALIAVVAIVALHFLGGSVANTINNAGSSLNNP
jgi:Flp pilus assembly pilin Flp